MTPQRRQAVRLTPFGKSVVVFLAIIVFLFAIFALDALLTAALHLPTDIEVSQ